MIRQPPKYTLTDPPLPYPALFRSTGVVKSVEFGHIVVNLGRAEGVIRSDQQIPRELMRVGDRVRAIILSVRSETRGPQIFLSRAHPDLMKKLFAQEVPEIYAGIIERSAERRGGKESDSTCRTRWVTDP